MTVGRAMNGDDDSSEVLPLIAFVGRPNVGKSSLFNRIVGRRKAIVQDEPGTTRDRNYDIAEWNGHNFRVVDTGGISGEQLEGSYASPVETQVQRAMEEADAICFVVDVQAGPIAADDDIAALLREASQPVYVVANKADNGDLALTATEFYALGLGAPQIISAHHGRGVGELLDIVTARLPAASTNPAGLACNLAIVGRPNVGKSSLVNAILHEDRMIVSEFAGTTRDAVDTAVTFEDQHLVLVDTAGIRRRGKVLHGPERASVRRATAAVTRADVVAGVIDVGGDVTAQDQHILQVALEAKKGVVLVMNKLDLLDGDAQLTERRQRQLRWRSRFVPWAPVVWISALKGRHVEDVLKVALSAAEERCRRVPTGRLNAAVRRAVVDHPPSAVKGRPIKIFYATQVGVEPPTFVFFSNYPESIHFSYERYLQRRIRDEFGFQGASLKLVFRKRGEPIAGFSSTAEDHETPVVTVPNLDSPPPPVSRHGSTCSRTGEND